jgi:uncharacterized protein (TIGR03435 family)
MQPMDDNVLLQKYAETNSDEAFAALVAKYINLVYSVAVRGVGNPASAEEIAQAVFIILARKAGQLRNDKALSSWLFKTTQLTANNYLRSEMRRQSREQEAHDMQTILNGPEPELWPKIAPLLDDAVAALNEKDRRAILLRFYEGKNLREIGNLLGSNESAAEKRVSRALEKLRKFFTKRGVSSTTAIIAGTISANSVQAAPVALAKSVTAVALAKGAAASGSTLTLIKGALKIMAWTKAKTVIVVGVGIFLAVGTATVAVKRIVESKEDDSWRVQQNFDSRILDRSKPQVRIVATKFPQFGGFGWNGDEKKIMGLGAPVNYIVEAAWNFGAHRIVFTTDVPTGNYDFIASLPSGNAEALRQEIREHFGLIGQVETIETNVLFLEVSSPNASGLKHSDEQYGSMSAGNGNFKCDGEPISTLAGDLLEGSFDIPVIDRTGLTGNFNINLKWKPGNLDNLKQEVANQLGLILVPGKAPIKMLVVEKAQ